jgi:hypothetical protein
LPAPVKPQAGQGVAPWLQPGRAGGQQLAQFAENSIQLLVEIVADP